MARKLLLASGLGVAGLVAYNRQAETPIRPLRMGLDALSGVAPGAVPAAQKVFWRRAYDLWGARGTGFYDGDGGAAFLNYGYAPLDAEVSPAEGFGAGLYDRVAGAVDLAGKDVLEVGCGRGAGAARVHARQAPGTLVGMDLAGASVEAATRENIATGLSFVQGDAENLPFGDESFDVVLNVESSHCYPDVPAFLAEVRRVLRPGGFLSLCDLRFLEPGGEGGFVQIGVLAELEAAIAGCGMEIVEYEDITANVRHALALDTPRRQALIDNNVPKPLRPLLQVFSGVEGAALHDDLTSGALRYVRYVLRKP